MNTRTLKALLKKDLHLFLSNRFYLLITILGIVFYITAYFLLPAQVDETLKLGLYAPQMPPAFSPQNLEEGVEMVLFDDTDQLQAAILDGRVQMGIALPAEIMQTWAEGLKPEIALYYGPDTAPELRDAIVKIVEELSCTETGQELNYLAHVETLGVDLMGDQIPLRDRLRPLLATVILLLEILTLASLISVEIEQGTARAILITPLRMSDLFFAKGVLGLIMALGQAILFMLIAGGFAHQPVIILFTLLLGSLMVVGAAFLLASLTRDVNTVNGWGLVVLIILAVPGFGVLISGLMSGWVRVIPSYYLTDTLNRVANYGMGWPDVYFNLIILAVIAALCIWGGMAALRRRYQ